MVAPHGIQRAFLLFFLPVVQLDAVTSVKFVLSTECLPLCQYLAFVVFCTFQQVLLCYEKQLVL